MEILHCNISVFPALQHLVLNVSEQQEETRVVFFLWPNSCPCSM